MAELDEYLATDTDLDALPFWIGNKKKFTRLYNPPMIVLSVPATSAPVERVFSHRTRMSAENLSW